MKTKKTLRTSKFTQRTPQVIKIVLLVLLVLAAGGAAWYLWIMPAQAKSISQAGSATSTATIERGNISLSASGTGTLVSNQSVNMRFSTSGKVAAVKVKLGDSVKAGDALASLEKADDLEASLATAQASLLEAQQALSALQESSGAALAQAYQQLVRTRAAYNQALAASQRTDAARCGPEMVSKYSGALESATQKLNDLIKSEPDSAARTIAGYDYDTALANYSYCMSYSSTEKTSAQSTLDVAKEALQAAEENYNTLKEAAGIDPDQLSMDETKVETAQALVDAAQEALDGTTLVAPMDGKITYLAASTGAIVDTSTFLTISDISHPTVTVSLDETDLDKLVVGNSAEVTFTALPGKTFTGQVSLANPQMNSFGPFRAATGQVALDASAAETLAKMPLGLSATSTITGKVANNVLLVPVTALKNLKDGGYAVMLVGSDGQLTQKEVTLGLQNSASVEITSGLKEGDVVRVTTNAKNTASGNEQGGQIFIEGGVMPLP